MFRAPVEPFLEALVRSGVFAPDYRPLRLGEGDARAISPDGKFGSALDPDATAEDGLGAFRYAAEAPLNIGDSHWTLECWLKAKPGMSGDNRIWGLSGVNYIDYGRGGKPGGLNIASRFLPIDGVEAWNKPTGNLQADQEFHHFAVVYDAARRNCVSFQSEGS